MCKLKLVKRMPSQVDVCKRNTLHLYFRAGLLSIFLLQANELVSDKLAM